MCQRALATARSCCALPSVMCGSTAGGGAAWALDPMASTPRSIASTPIAMCVGKDRPRTALLM